MKSIVNERLKSFLLNFFAREKETRQDTWKHLKMLDLDCDDLDIVMAETAFADEAWEIYRTKNPSKESLLHVMKRTSKSQEAEAFLAERFALDNDDLHDLVEETGQDKFARLLFQRNPDNEQLMTILKHSNLKDEAAAELLKRPLENDELRDIIANSNLGKADAWERLAQQNPTNEALSEMIRYTDLGDLEERVWNRFLSQNPTNDELLDFVKDYSETGRKKQEAAALLIGRDLDTETLADLIVANQFVDIALKKLYDKKPDCEELEFVFRVNKGGVNEVAALSLSLHPDKEQLWEILEKSDKKAEAALQLLQFPLESHELADLIVATTIAPVLELISERVGFDRSQVDEEGLIREIAQKILKNPELLDVNHWHNEEKHCLGGWAITLNEASREIERQFGSEIAAGLLLPHYNHLFFADRKTVLEALKKKSIT